jgi:hypothetical protein
MPWTNAEYHPMIRKVNFDDFDMKWDGSYVFLSFT